jgi:hypothetical protein
MVPMILAGDEVTGGLIAAAAFLLSLVVSVIALAALVPAWRGNRTLAIGLASPALVAVVLVTGFVVYGYLTDGLKNRDYSASDFVIPWVIFAGLPAITGGVAMGLALARRRSLAP